MAKLVALLLLAAIPLVAHGNAIRKDVPLQPNFDLSRYTGKWFEMYRSKHMPFESGTDVTAVYGANPDGTVSVTNSEWLPEQHKWNVANATAKVIGNAHLSVKFGRFQPAGDYRVVSTDYTGFSVVFSESKLGPITINYGWILARDVNIDNATLNKALDIMAERTGLTRDHFHKTEHGIAPTQAEAVLATADRAYGEVPLQPDFDIKQYMGLWYEIYRTTNMEFQPGVDGTAHYALNNDGTVAVTNTEWIVNDQEWSTARALGRQIDGAQLTVQFGGPFAPQGDYRVMFTDYSGITVIYSRSSKYSRIYGWILARKPELTFDEETKAFDLFESVGLEKSEFMKSWQGVATLPRPSPYSATEAIAVPFAYGTVPVQPDFDPSQYLGKWYEIYRTKNMIYESGTDNTAEYSLNNDGTIAVHNSEWLPNKNEWNVANGIAKIVANAQLEVKFSPLQPPADYRVLYTDYNGISVVYSKTSKFLPTFGWMLARTPQVSQEQIDLAFKYFNNVAGLTMNDFHKTQQGIAPSDF